MTVLLYCFTTVLWLQGKHTDGEKEDRRSNKSETCFLENVNGNCDYNDPFCALLRDLRPGKHLTVQKTNIGGSDLTGVLRT